MAFRLKNDPRSKEIEADVHTNDGDLNIVLNGVLVGFIGESSGKLKLFPISEPDREKLPGLSLSNGYLSVDLRRR